MCGTLRYEDKHLTIGNLVNVFNPSTRVSGRVIWSGFVRTEKWDWWQSQGNGTPILIRADSFFEKGYEFQVPGLYILGMGLRRDVDITKEGKVVTIGPRNTVRLVTRRPRTETESAIHKRWPVVQIDYIGDYLFENKDILSYPSGHQMELK